MHYDLTISIVTYNTNKEELLKVLKCLEKIKVNKRIFISDNSEKQDIKKVIEELNSNQIEYVFNNSFLTEKACREHIECNRHHYRNPVDYLNYAFRNPEMEKLLRILSKIEIKEES